MLDAYRGTIDDSGETLADAHDEVQAYLVGQRGGPALLQESCLGFVNNQLVAACLVTQGETGQHPLIAYVMTHADWKNQGIGRAILTATVQTLARSHYPTVWAVITQGNTPSERLFDPKALHEELTVAQLIDRCADAQPQPATRQALNPLVGQQITDHA